jgi:hypothetical protein
MARYIPDRGEIVWLDFEPKRGKEIGKIFRPWCFPAQSTIKKPGC